MSMATDLNEAKQRLLDKLGDNYGPYIQILGKWFRGIISKDEFDAGAKQLVGNNFVIEHNKFWLAFFHHCANNATKNSHSFRIADAINTNLNQKNQDDQHNDSRDSMSTHFQPIDLLGGPKVRCLPNKVITHMKMIVIAWEMGLDSVSDDVTSYINLALHHLLKNIITELVCAKTAYRLRENRFKHAIGVKPINPYLNNSLKIYNANLEYDPYQIESNRMNSSLVDTHAYNDSLFPSRLYEAQALYEYACSTTSIDLTISPNPRQNKRPKLSDNSTLSKQLDNDEPILNEATEHNSIDHEDVITSVIQEEDRERLVTNGVRFIDGQKRLTLFHLLTAFKNDKTILPSHSLYTTSLERILIKLSH